MTPAAESVTGPVVAAGPGIVGALVLMFGFRSPEALIVAAVVIGGGLGAYSGATFQMLRDLGNKAPTGLDWIRLALRITASWAFAACVTLALSAVAGSIESVPDVAAHPFVLVAVAALLAAVAPLAVPALQLAAAKKVKEHASPEPKP